MRCRLGRGLVAAVLLPTLLAACGDDNDDAESDAALDLPVITPSEPWERWPAADVRGRVRLENNCLVMDGHVLVWPKGTTWDGDSQSVVSPDGEVWATVGEDFSGSGGWRELEPGGYAEWLGDEDAGEALVGCLDATGAVGAVLAHG